MSDEVVRVWTEGQVGIMELNRPAVFNCLALSVMEALNAGMRHFEDGEEVHVVLIRSTGKHFCTGADLDEVKGKRSDLDALKHFISYGHGVLRSMENSTLPVIVAVHGLALAGGLELMMAADVAFAGESARLGCQHAQFGLIPGWGGTQRLPRIVGQRRALDLMFSARWIDAREAQIWGLVNYVVPDAELHARAMEYCQTLAARNTNGIATMKRLTEHGLSGNLDYGLALEATEAPTALMSDNVTEGLNAFQEKRQPNFK
ncbi:MAG: enoyl-CoA hydratase/isomerase family protein [Alphaproteobacteria bacterium]|nr:enoyl-CoA hydratase/isomerase family protein [Alphaproteobacteria bacterium]